MPSLRSLFAAVVFLAAFLLFFVEPIAAKQLLPLLGGSAAVWITCLVFFQTALLLGYLYAHWLGTHPNWRMNAVLLVLGVVSAIDARRVCGNVDSGHGQLSVLPAAGPGSPRLSVRKPRHHVSRCARRVRFGSTTDGYRARARRRRGFSSG